ncbi:hypothetical protein BKA70DRAFT_1426660 [Coprinopsis sp. MPI-PUGE-AT-0042]|nr:hypothetical protein BKA70DRAFT_1426660 [Coprinopsis sp. MPI-PUGE-AT-0042]
MKPATAFFLVSSQVIAFASFVAAERCPGGMAALCCYRVEPFNPPNVGLGCIPFTYESCGPGQLLACCLRAGHNEVARDCFVVDQY